MRSFYMSDRRSVTAPANVIWKEGAISLVFSDGSVLARSTSMTTQRKNPHAMALGRLGGLKGGPARAEKLSARQRREIARRAANARWKAADSR
jgi:hypothetical protein